MMLLFSNVICLILNEVPLWIGWADMKETDDIITNFEIFIILLGIQYKFKSIIYIMIQSSILFK